MANSISTLEIFPNTRRDSSSWNLTEGAGRRLNGDSAHREISSKLLNYPAAQQLSREVFDFYGNYLTYIESWNFPSTIFTINMQHDPIALKSAEIRLQLGTDRIIEALVHELLHLRLPILGYPLGELVKIHPLLNHYAQTYLGMCNWVVNIVQHEINFQSFIALGFDKRHFLAKFVTPMNYRKLLNPKPKDVHAEKIDFPRWCIEYVRHLFTARQGGSNDHLQCAQDALDWGSRLHPELKQTAAEIDRWFEAGAFKDPHQYPRQVNLLLDLMRIPNFTGWVVLNMSESKKPIAIRLGTDGSVLPRPVRMM